MKPQKPKSRGKTVLEGVRRIGEANTLVQREHLGNMSFGPEYERVTVTIVPKKWKPKKKPRKKSNGDFDAIGIP